MAITRRGIIGIMGTALAAPGIVRAEALMRPPRRPVLLPDPTIRIYGVDQYGSLVTERIGLDWGRWFSEEIRAPVGAKVFYGSFRLSRSDAITGGTLPITIL